MKKTLTLSAVAAMTLGTLAAPAFAGDPAAGERAWRGCRSCHAIVSPEGETIQRGGRTGPNLYGLPGAPLAHDADFRNYSDGLKALGEQGMVWTEELFTEWVTNPTDFLRNHTGDSGARSNMNFRLRSGAEDLWAYLESVSPAAE